MFQRPRTGHSAVSASESAGLVTAAMTASVGVALLVAAVAPARGLPFDVRPAARPQSEGVPAPSLQRQAYRSKERVKEATPADDIKARAKGPMSIVISLDKQQLTLYSGDQPIAHSRVSTGVPGHPTPMGVFSVIQKDRWHRSNLYNDAPMYFMQRITWSGVAMHQGVVPNHPASHGCIRLPEAFARQLWGITGLGARVIIARTELTPAAISNPKLFVFKPRPPEPEPVLPKPDTSETVGSATEAIKAAYGAFDDVQIAAPRSLLRATATDVAKPDPVLAAAARPLKPGPISVFVSRKEGKVFVRKGFDPVFDAPVSFEQPDQPLGTHVFTALALNDDNSTLRWMVVSVPTNIASQAKKAEKGKKGEAVQVAHGPVRTTAAEALERVTIPQDALDRIQDLMSAGASLIISDQGLGPETGKGTDFIVLAR